MQTYICKCGKTFEKSTNAETTGYVLDDYSSEHECYGCPYIVNDRDWKTNEIIKRECRATPKITYLTRCKIGTDSGDFSACRLYSLDLTFVKRVMNYVNSLDGVESTEFGNRVPDEWRAADFGQCYSFDDCFGLAIFSLEFKKNKKGTQARRMVKERFFYEDGRHINMTEDEEREIILTRIEIAKENAGNKTIKKIVEEENGMKFDINNMIGGSQQTAQTAQTSEIPLDMLVPYHNHKFTLYEGERLEDMVRSIAKNGVLVPIIVTSELTIRRRDMLQAFTEISHIYSAYTDAEKSSAFTVSGIGIRAVIPLTLPNAWSEAVEADSEITPMINA